MRFQAVLLIGLLALAGAPALAQVDLIDRAGNRLPQFGWELEQARQVAWSTAQREGSLAASWNPAGETMIAAQMGRLTNPSRTNEGWGVITFFRTKDGWAARRVTGPRLPLGYGGVPLPGSAAPPVVEWATGKSCPALVEAVSALTATAGRGQGTFLSGTDGVSYDLWSRLSDQGLGIHRDTGESAQVEKLVADTEPCWGGLQPAALASLK